MATLSYSAITNYPFQPFTKIYSADTNAMFAAIQTFINTPHNFTRNGSSSALAAGTANYVVYNDSNGDLTEAAQLPITKGGLGADLTPSGLTQAGYSIVVNTAGTGFTLSTSSNLSSVFNFFNFS